MAAFSSNNYRDSTSQASRSSFDSSNGNESSDKASLLEREDDNNSIRNRRPLNNRHKGRRVLKIFGFTISAALCGFALVLLTWRITMLNTKCNCSTMQKMTKAPPSFRPIPDMFKVPEPTSSDTDGSIKQQNSGITDDMFMFEDWKDCGKTADEARSKGCHFDIMLSTWVHKDCFDEEMMERYVIDGKYTWYRDSEMLEPIPNEELRRGDHHTAYTSAQQHNAHCGYMWEIQMKAWMRGRPISRTLFSYEHTSHCAEWLVTRPPSDNTLLITDFDQCGIPKQYSI